LGCLFVLAISLASEIAKAQVLEDEKLMVPTSQAGDVMIPLMATRNSGSTHPVEVGRKYHHYLQVFFKSPSQVVISPDFLPSRVEPPMSYIPVN